MEKLFFVGTEELIRFGKTKETYFVEQQQHFPTLNVISIDIFLHCILFLYDRVSTNEKKISGVAAGERGREGVRN